jgi:hypothetical protein
MLLNFRDRMPKRTNRGAIELLKKRWHWIDKNLLNIGSTKLKRFFSDLHTNRFSIDIIRFCISVYILSDSGGYATKFALYVYIDSYYYPNIHVVAWPRSVSRSPSLQQP